MTKGLFDQYANDNQTSSERSSSQNAIDELNLLTEEDDDESEWNEPPKTVFDRDAINEESKFIYDTPAIQAQDDLSDDEVAVSDDSSISSGDSDD